MDEPIQRKSIAEQDAELRALDVPYFEGQKYSKGVKVQIAPGDVADELPTS